MSMTHAEKMAKAEESMRRPPNPKRRSAKQVRKEKRPKDRGVIHKQGVPCRRTNDTWRGAAKAIARRGIQAISVLSSGAVPEDVFDERMAICRDCVHSTALDREGEGKVLHYCQCCGCGMWSGLGEGSDLEHKNLHAAHVCPAEVKRFDAWSGVAQNTKNPLGLVAGAGVR